MDHILEMRDIHKTFGEVEALHHVNFAVGRNEVVGLLGDNGAGKSTLIKIITGYHHPDKGEVYINGQRVDNFSVAQARQLGIETVYQERALAGSKSAYPKKQQYASSSTNCRNSSIVEAVGCGS